MWFLFGAGVRDKLTACQVAGSSGATSNRASRDLRLPVSPRIQPQAVEDPPCRQQGFEARSLRDQLSRRQGSCRARPSGQTVRGVAETATSSALPERVVPQSGPPRCFSLGDRWASRALMFGQPASFVSHYQAAGPAPCPELVVPCKRQTFHDDVPSEGVCINRFEPVTPLNAIQLARRTTRCPKSRGGDAQSNSPLRERSTSRAKSPSASITGASRGFGGAGSGRNGRSP
jgi:hypothetical protein